VKIAPCDVGIFFKTDDVKDIVAVGNLPGVDILGILVSVIPEKKCVDEAFLRGAVRVTGDNESILLLGLKKDLLIGPRSWNKFFDIDQEEMSRFVRRKRVLGNLDSRNNQHPVSIPCPLGLFSDVRHIRTKTVLCHGELEPIRKFPQGIVPIHHMIRNSNDIKTCLAKKVYRSSETHGAIGVSCVNMEIAKQHSVRNLNRLMLRIDDEKMIFWLKNGPGFDDIGIKGRSDGRFTFQRIIIDAVETKPCIESSQPLIIVQQRPIEITPYVYPLLQAFFNHIHMALNEFFLFRVIDSGNPIFGNDDRNLKFGYLP
jgi:hypothetical protein